MILAQNQFQTVILLVLSFLCWGLWPAIYRRTVKWRYELFYFDVAFGVAIAAVVYAMTVGSLGFDGFTFMDDIAHASKRFWVMAFGAGVIFNLANMVLMGAIAVSGLSVAIPVGLGVSTMFGLGITVLFRHSGNPILLFLGTACLLVAVVVVGAAYSFLITARQDKLVKEGKVKTTASLPGHSKAMILSTDAPSATKPLLLAAISAALMWVMYPLINKARVGDTGLGPYSLTTFIALGVFSSTIVFNLFFINLPVDGDPIELFQYFRGRMKNHVFGVLAGMILCTGILAELVAAAGEPEAQVSPVLTYAFKQAAVLAAALWGLWVWKDFRDAEPRVRAMVYAFLALFAAGILCFAAASKLS